MSEVREEAKKLFAKIQNVTEQSEREKLLQDLAGSDDDLLVLDEFFDNAFDEISSKHLALLWYYCAKYRMYCEQVPPYVDFMPKLSTNPTE